jgi:hypothetical protein
MAFVGKTSRLDEPLSLLQPTFRYVNQSDFLGIAVVQTPLVE